MARAEMLDGGAGEDTLSGEAGSDVLFGGAGNDIFTSSASAFNLDTISDFAVGDSIVVTGADLSALNGEAASGTIDLGSGLELTLAGITAASGTRSEEHTSELQSLMRISYAVFCLKKKTKHNIKSINYNKITIATNNAI